MGNWIALVTGATRTFTIANQEAAWRAYISISSVGLSYAVSLKAVS